MGVLLLMLQYAQYRLMIIEHSTELYVGLIALFFTAVGIWAGAKLTASSRYKQTPDAGQPTQMIASPEQLNITPRELEVLHYIALGLSNQEIADKMFVSLNTVKTHASSVFAKLKARRRTQAIQHAKAMGLLS